MSDVAQAASNQALIYKVTIWLQSGQTVTLHTSRDPASAAYSSTCWFFVDTAGVLWNFNPQHVACLRSEAHKELSIPVKV